jgi:ribosomal-protein-serine acetyltransferase
MTNLYEMSLDPLVGERVALAFLELEDSEEFLDLVNSSRSFLREWLPWVDRFSTLMDAYSQIEAYSLQQTMSNGGLWGVRRLEDGALMGIVCLQWVHWEHRSASLEYWLGTSYTGQGYASEALRLVQNYCFNSLRLHRLELHVACKNAKSEALARRVGFVEEGLCRDYEYLHESYWDHHIFSILAKECSFTQVNDISLPG